nr:hypothetical protein [Tanacetum cinerariifolium]
MINAQVDDLSSHNTNYTSPALTQNVFANIRRIGKGFSGVDTPLFDTMLVQPQVQDAAEVEEDDEESATPTPPSPTPATTPPPPPPQQQPTQHTDTSESSMTLLNTLMETFFNEEEVTMTMAQTLIKIKAEKARILDEQMAKRLQDEKIKQAAAREKQEKEDLERAKVLQQQYDQKQENIDWNVVAEQMQEKHLDNINKYQILKRKPIFVAVVVVMMMEQVELGVVREYVLVEVVKIYV